MKSKKKNKLLMRIGVLLAAAALVFLTSCQRAQQGQWQECVWLACEGGPALVLLKYDGETPDAPCTLGGLTDDERTFLQGLHTGDVIRIRINSVMESYPAQTFVNGLEFVREGKPDDVDAELIAYLREMGYLIITDDSGSGLPDFEFTLQWNTFGISHYDSATGELIKTTDATKPEDYVTTHILTEEERHKVWEYLINLPYTSYPEEYLPNPDGGMEPDETITLSVRTGDTEHTITTRASAFYGIKDQGVKNGADNFMKSIRGITELLQETEEWKALPDYEFYYE